MSKNSTTKSFALLLISCRGHEGCCTRILFRRCQMLQAMVENNATVKANPWSSTTSRRSRKDQYPVWYKREKLGTNFHTAFAWLHNHNACMTDSCCSSHKEQVSSMGIFHCAIFRFDGKESFAALHIKCLIFGGALIFQILFHTFEPTPLDDDGAPLITSVTSI